MMRDADSTNGTTSVSRLRRSALVAGVTAIVAALGTLPAWAADASLEETIEFDDLTWTVVRGTPSSYTVGTDTLTFEIDSEVRGTGQNVFEGIRAELPAGPGGQPVHNVGSTLFVDPVWEDVTGVEAGLWLRVPSAAGDAWPTLVVTNAALTDASGYVNPAGDPIAVVFDTFSTGGVWQAATPVAYGDSVDLEIAYNPLTTQYEYLVNGTVIFTHGRDGYAEPTEVLFVNYNPGPGSTENANDYTVAWRGGLTLGSKIDPPEITTTTLADGTDGAAYDATIAATSDTPADLAPIAFSITAGALPPGLTLDPDTGAISGTPTEPGTFTFTVEADNGAATTGTAELSITIQGVAPSITTATLPDATDGVAYSAAIEADGSADIAFSVTAGELPDGLTLDPATGEITGTPSGAGTFTFTATATNDFGTDAQELTIMVDGVPPQLVEPAPDPDTGVVTLPAATVGEPYSVQFTAAGTAPMTFAITEGELPAGLTLDAETGLLSGTPTSNAVYEFTLTVTNEFGSVDIPVSLEVNAAATDDPTEDPTAAPAPPALPQTGSDVGPSAALGAVLLLAGSGLLIARRRLSLMER